MWEKADKELQITTTKICRDEKKCQAKIAVLCTLVTALVQIIPTQIKRGEDLLGEISPAILLIARRYPELPKTEITRIYENCFKPKNLYKFCHLKGREDKNRDKNIRFENG